MRGCPLELLGGLSLSALADVGGWVTAFGVTLYAARMVITGRLVPRSTHEDTVKALEIERERNRLLVEQNGRATDALETLNTFLRALPQPQPQPQPPSLQHPRRGGGR
jgi:hypothetical protein